jgi:uncharacterized protein involved in exopolysaccharide biosynthesis
MTLLDLAIALARHKRLVVGIPFAAGVVAAAITLMMPNIYSATARILPPQQGSSATASSLMAQVGALSSGATALLALKNPSDLYVGMLRSNTVADALIKRFDLRTWYGEKTLVQTRRSLSKAATITVIEVSDEKPQRAADLANGYAEELERLTVTLAISEAAQRRLFFEKQLKHAKEDLAEAELALKRTQESTGLIKLDEQGRALIESVARIRAEIAAKEVQLAAMRTYATAQNPDFVMLQQQIAGLRDQVSKLEGSAKLEKGSLLVTGGNVSEAGLEYIRRVRDVKYQEAIFEVLIRQLELAKIDEAREASIVQVLDTATPPDRKAKPKRLLITLVTAIVSGLITVLYVLLKEIAHRGNANDLSEKRWAQLRSYLKLRNANH